MAGLYGKTVKKIVTFSISFLVPILRITLFQSIS